MKKLIVFVILIFFISSASFAVVRVKDLNTLTEIKDLSEGNPEPSGLPRFNAPSGVVIDSKERSAFGGTSPANRRLSSPFEFGISLGLLAGIPGASMDFKWNQFMGIEPLSLKGGVMYAQGKDLDEVERKNALIFLDGIFRFNQPVKRDNGYYLGGGLNYLAYTTGQMQGGVGAEIYLGIDSIIGKETESVYLELGYGLIRTGFSPDFNGWNAMLGYRTKI